MAKKPSQRDLSPVQDTGKEFQEIARSGGRIEFVREDGQVKSIQLSGNGGGVLMFQLMAAPDGRVRNIVHSQGFMPNGLPPDPLIPVWMISDKEGLFGRTCSECKSYFRSDCVTEDTACPYCGHWDNCVAFITPNHQEFITQYCKLFIEALEQQKELIVNLNEFIDSLADNKPTWIYSEERQQNRFSCKNCGTIVDVLGDYAGCPKCGRRNYKEVIEEKFHELERQFHAAFENSEGRQEREVEWEKLLRCVSEFEAMSNDLRGHLLRLPTTPKRRGDLGTLSFQRILKVNEALNNWFGFEILQGISPNDREFINMMFNRRHVFTHNAGRVDQEYLNNTHDTSVRLNQKIRLRSNEIKRLIPLVRRVANNLIEGYESIS